MDCRSLNARELPHTTRLLADFLDDFDRVARFYAHPPSVQGIERAATANKTDEARLNDAVGVLREQNRSFGADESTERSLARLATGAVAVVTGQQVGLFSGPSYSFCKALTAIRVASLLTESGTDAVPIFWLATEDHDLGEVNHSYWLGRSAEPVSAAPLERFEIQIMGPPGRRVGEIELGDALAPLLTAATALLDGPASHAVSRALAEAYQPAETFGSAFAKLMARLLRGRGLILLDALDARLHKLSRQVYRGVLEASAPLAAGLMARNRELDQAGYHAQVKVSQRSTLLFLNVAGQRLPLHRRNADFVAGREAFSLGQLLDLLESMPEAFSANVLLRPVVQDFLLPTAAYIGGPAEVAYFAQAETIYRRLGVPMPAILLRAGFTLIEPHVTRLLKKYKLDVRDILRGRQHLRARLEREFLSRQLARQFTISERNIRRMLTRLRRPLRKLDKTLDGARDTAERKMLYQFLKLRAKAGRAENKRTGILDKHERILLDSVYPQHGLQERSLCLLPFLARHGLSLLDELQQRAGVNNTHHLVLFL